MRKIIYVIAACLFLMSLTTIVKSQTPIAIKSIGIDSVSGLEQQIVVNQITINSQAEIVIIEYQIQTLSPNGRVVSVGQNKTFTRFNQPAKDSTPAVMNFDILRASFVGQAIIGMINADLNDYPNLEQK